MSLSFEFEFTEMEGSPREHLDLQSGWKITRKFLVAWDNRWAFAAGLLGGSTGFFPSQYPGVPAARCTSVEIEPIGKNPIADPMTDPESHLAGYNNAIVTATYSSLPTNNRQTQPDNTYITYEGSSTAEFLTLPSRALVWQDTSTPVGPDVSAAIIVPTVRHTLTWHDVLSPPWETYSKLKGQVNQEDFTVPAIGLVAPAETLLFEGFETRTKVNASGVDRWQITMHFAERRIVALVKDTAVVYGWNHSYRERKVSPGPPGWFRTVWIDDEGEVHPVYLGGDLTTLFTQAP